MWNSILQQHNSLWVQFVSRQHTGTSRPLTPYSPVSWLVIAHRSTSMFLAFLSSVVTRPVTPKNQGHGQGRVSGWGVSIGLKHLFYNIALKKNNTFFNLLEIPLTFHENWCRPTADCIQTASLAGMSTPPLQHFWLIILLRQFCLNVCGKSPRKEFSRIPRLELGISPPVPAALTKHQPHWRFILFFFCKTFI